MMKKYRIFDGFKFQGGNYCLHNSIKDDDNIIFKRKINI